MKTLAILTISFLLLLTSLGARQSSGPGAMPPNHPQVPGMPKPESAPPADTLPPNHPPIEIRPDLNDLPAPPPANPDDVKSLDAIVLAYYQTISGARGEKRNWDRLRSLFVPEARFITGRMMNELTMPLTLTTEQFIDLNRAYFENGGYYEDEIHRHVDSFGHIAQAFSTYETRRNRDETQAYSRGINSMQFHFDGSRWWIISIMWDHERPENPIPKEYRP